MVRNNSNGYICFIILFIRNARNLTYLCTKRKNRIHIKNGIHILNDGSKPFKPHTRIDIFLGQFRIIAFSVIIELCKDIIPDFHIAVTIAANRTARFATAISLSPVIINFGTGAAGA